MGDDVRRRLEAVGIADRGTLVVTFPAGALESEEDAERVKAELAEKLPRGVHVVVIDGATGAVWVPS
jgi:hypothetical protein